MKKLMLYILLIIVNVFFSTESAVWGANGHRIVAKICDWHLTENAKLEVKKILGKEYLEEASTWPDYIKSERGWKFADEWHYTTVQPDQSVEDMQMQYSGDKKISDATEAIDLMTKILKGDEASTSVLEELMEENRAKPLNGSTKATALAFLTHLVGDIHQPMHVGKNKDRGGNNITVLYFKERRNLHGIWDTDMIEHERLSYTEFSYFINKLDENEVQELQGASIQDWARESIELREHIYNTIYDYTDRETGLPSFSWQYQHDNLPHIEKRLVSAGIRLAGILNTIFK